MPTSPDYQFYRHKAPQGSGRLVRADRNELDEGMECQDSGGRVKMVPPGHWLVEAILYKRSYLVPNQAFQTEYERVYRRSYNIGDNYGKQRTANIS